MSATKHRSLKIVTCPHQWISWKSSCTLLKTIICSPCCNVSVSLLHLQLVAWTLWMSLFQKRSPYFIWNPCAKHVRPPTGKRNSAIEAAASHSAKVAGSIYSSGGSNGCILLWMRRAADGPAVWQAALSTGLPETWGPSTWQNGAGWVHTLASGVTDGIQSLPAKGLRCGQGALATHG